MKLTKKITDTETLYFKNGVKKYSHYKGRNVENCIGFENSAFLENDEDYESWREYNNNNEVHYENSENYEYWKEYDSNNNEIHFKDSDGLETWTEYDKNNNQSHYKDNKGFEIWNDKDSDTQCKEEEFDVEPFTFKKTDDLEEETLPEFQERFLDFANFQPFALGSLLTEDVMISEDLQLQMRNLGYKGKFVLSELIEACGDKFPFLGRNVDNKWACCDPDSGNYNTITEGDTTEESVAKLWLKLNK